MRTKKVFVLERGNFKDTSEVLQDCINKMSEKFNVKVLKTYNFSDRSIAEFSQNLKVFIYNRQDSDFDLHFVKYI